MMKEVIVFILTIFTLFEMYKCLLSFSGKVVKSNKKILGIIVIFSSFYSVFYTTYPPEIYSFLPLIFIVSISYFYLKFNFKESIFGTVIIGVLAIGIDFIAIFITNILLNTKIIDATYIDNLQLISSFFLIVMFYLISKSHKISKLVKNLFKKMNKINNSLILMVGFLILYFSLGIICLFKINNQNIIILCILIVITSLLTAISFIVSAYQIKTLKETRNLLIKNNEFYINVIDDYRIIKHNLTNKLLGLKTTANKKTKLLINDIILEYNPKFSPMKDIKNIPAGINGIIYEKLYNVENYENLNIVIDNKIKNNILDKLSSKSYNLLCETLGIVLDNAIEASLKSNEKVIYLKMNENPNSLNIKIQNTFAGEVDLEKLGNKNYSSKGTGRGLGLVSLFRNQLLKTETLIKNNLFIVKIEVNKK